MEAKRIHFIGICGVAMSALAAAFKNAGWHVTGSDVGFFPPISTYLQKNNINFYPGWHVDKMVAGGVPDLVVVGNVAGSTNPEYVFVQQNNITYASYPEVVAEKIVAENSIVCAGTYGKTSSSVLLTHILQEAEMAPSYMFGGLSANISTSARLKQNDTAWSVLEGDEYKIARWDNRPKFALYRPTHLLLTSISWDHADLYPTEDLYINVFNELVKNIPTTGIIVACSDSEAVSKAVLQAQARIITYGKNSKADYVYSDINQTRAGLQFTISHNNKAYTVSAPILGAHMAENICGAFALATEIGIDPNRVIASISRFTGFKRRLEKRYEGFVTIFDDLAHSPTKATATLKTLRAIYPNQHIFAIFEPNTGNRTQQSIPGYAQAFADANTVLIPTLTKVKVDEKNENPPFDGAALSQVISKDHPQVLYIEKDTELIDRIVQDAKKEDIIVFLGSHGFRGMIDELVRHYQER